VFAVMKLKFGIVKPALSRTEEECHPTVRGVCAGESVLGAEKTVASGPGLGREHRFADHGRAAERAEDPQKPNPIWHGTG